MDRTFVYLPSLRQNYSSRYFESRWYGKIEIGKYGSTEPFKRVAQ